MRFSDLKQGDRARISQIHDHPSNIRLQEMGLTIGTEFNVVKVAPFGDPIEVEFRGSRLCLRRVETEGYDLEILG